MKDKSKNIIKGKTILITGGTGSFGNSVVGKLLELDPRRIIIFSRDEKKQFDMRNKYATHLLKFVIGDVRDKDSLERIMQNVDYIFHAAALKQVPTCEFFPLEAVKTNILGANNVINVAIDYGVKKVIILSTDKAVYPINAMGMSKALMEKVMIANARKVSEANNTRPLLCGVRYGNVLYSRGSVLPYFVECIEKDKELTVTNPNMTRFLLPLPQAVELVLYALTNGENGNIYVRKATAATIKTLTEAMCKIFKHKKGYKEVGLRAGEKMHETLITREESIRSIDRGNYYQIPSESQGLDYNQYFFKGSTLDMEKVEPYTSENTKRLEVDETTDLLLSVPEIKSKVSSIKK